MIAFIPPKEKFGAYLFDCDGTLADTMPLHYEAWKQAVIEHGANFDYSVELFYSMAGMSVQDTITRLNEMFKTDLDPNEVGETKNALYSERLQFVKPIQGVVDFCLDCLSSTAKVAVVSGSSRKEVEATLEIIGLGGKIETTVCQGETELGKPHPQPFTYAANLLSTPYEDCLVLEDSAICIEGVKSEGMSALFIPNSML